MANDKIIIDLEIGLKKLKNQLGDAEGESEKAGKKSGTSFAKGFSASMKRGADSFKTSLSGIKDSIFNLKSAFLVVGATALYAKSIKEANILQNSMVGLRAVANATGTDFNRLENDVKSLAEDGLIPVANITSSLKNLLAKGFTADQALKTFKTLRDSASFNRQGQLELGQAVEGATQGLKNELSMLVDNAGITKNLSVMYKEFAKSIGKTVGKLTEAEKVQAQYNGIQREGAVFQNNYALSLQTYSGAMAKLTGSFRFLLVAVGEFTTKSPVSIAIITFIGTKIKDMTKAAEEFRTSSGGIFDTMVVKAIEFAKTINDYLILPITVIGRVVNVAFNVIKTGLQTVITAYATAADTIVGVMVTAITKALQFIPDRLIPAGFKESLDEAKRMTADFASSSQGVLSEFAKEANDNISNIFSPTEFSNKTGEFLAELESVVVEAQKLGSEIDWSKFLAKLDRSLVATGKTAKAVGYNINKALGSSVASGLTTMFNSINDSKNVLSAFGDFILGVFGSLATQMGQFFVAAGIAQLKLFALDPTGTIAAGIGLIALGSLLSSFQSSGMTATAASDGASYAPTVDTEEAVTEVPEQKASVVLNIEGNYFDSEESNLKIVDMLNAAVDSNDVQIRQGAFA